VRDSSNGAIWNSKTFSPGAKFIIDEKGKASIILGEAVIWSTDYVSTDNVSTSRDPIFNPNFQKFNSNIVLSPRGSLPKGRFVTSPSNVYKIGLNGDGNLVFQSLSDSKTIWHAGISGGTEAYMQPDGNFVVRDGSRKVLWTSHTGHSSGARLEIDDGGRIAVLNGQTTVWIQGLPRGKYTGPSSPDIQFPLRTTFYYPWYPETWTVNGKKAHYIPDLGEYSSDDAAVVEDHIDQMEYGYMDLVVSSWWGPDEQQERSRLSRLMDKTIEMNASFKWYVLSLRRYRFMVGRRIVLFSHLFLLTLRILGRFTTNMSSITTLHLLN
jgi:Glycosyl hydrolase family 99